MGPKRTQEAERRINIGSQFQSELPDLQDPARLEEEEEGASLVWKPWGDVETNPETQEKVRNLLHLASAKGGPGGRVNAELALHCLHEAQGDVLEAAEMLRAGPPRRPESHPLADYHYTGSDTWTPVEEQLFKEAFYLHKKNFRLIQKQIQTKSVSQCVEYYYTWKKKTRFGCTRPRLKQKKRPRRPDEEEEVEKLLGE
ncbi:zinc finger protein 541-like [Chroicocephalus ridibundus]|uniref:zinc finger protein 541-like n=1 Tax=Chroicocephalus ridibundus TaxID=1192867 RepID=UPI002FDCE55F